MGTSIMNANSTTTTSQTDLRPHPPHRRTGRESITVAMATQPLLKELAAGVDDDEQQHRGSSTTLSLSNSYDLSGSLSSEDVEAALDVSVVAVGKTVRFAEESEKEVFRYRRAVGNDLFIDGKEQGARSKAIRKEAQQWKDVGMKLLEDIHTLPVSERIDRITKLHALAGEARGLEKDICPKLSERARIQRKRTIRVVLEHQVAHKESTHQHRAKIIAKACMELSHGARCMARILGLADQQYIKDSTKKTSASALARRRSESDLFSEDMSSAFTAAMNLSGSFSHKTCSGSRTSATSTTSTTSRTDEMSGSSMMSGSSSSNNNNSNSSSTFQNDSIRRRRPQQPTKSLSLVRRVGRIGRTVSKKVKRVGSSRNIGASIKQLTTESATSPTAATTTDNNNTNNNVMGIKRSLTR